MRERLDNPFDGNDEWEQTLARLQPRASSVPRDRLMFLAGRHAALREKHSSRRWTWPLATAASWLVTAMVAGLWMQSVSRPQQIPVATNERPKSEDESGSQPVLHPDNDLARLTSSFTEETQQADKLDRPPKSAPGSPLSALRSPPSSLRSPHSYRRSHPQTIESLLDRTDQPRLSMVGWRSWDRSREALADTHPPVDVDASIAVPPATYSRLMKLYLDDEAAPGFQGDLL